MVNTKFDFDLQNESRKFFKKAIDPTNLNMEQSVPQDDFLRTDK